MEEDAEDAVHVQSPPRKRPAVERALQRDADERTKTLEGSLADVTKKYETNKLELEAANERIRELEKCSSSLTDDLRDAQECAKIHQSNSDSFRRQLDSASEIQDSLTNMIDTRNTEIECLKSTVENLQFQLQASVNVKCDALFKNKSIQSRTMSNYYRDVHLEQEKVGQSGQLEILRNELFQSASDLQNVQSDLASLQTAFESQMARKNDELNASNVKITKLYETKENLNKKIEELNKNLAEQLAKEHKMSEDYNNNLLTKTKLIELYKNAQDDSNAKNEELTKAIVELKQLLTESTDKYDELEKNLKLINSEHKEVLDDKNEKIAALKRELENANELLQMTDSDYLHSAMEDLSPAASLASRFIKSRMSITQAYDQLIQLSEELSVEKIEKKHIVHTVNVIVKDLEEKAPVFQQQKMQLEETLEQNSLLNERLESLILQHNQLKDENAETLKLSAWHQKENHQLKTETKDLSNQVCFLLREVESKKGRFFAYDNKNASNSSSLDLNASDIITEKLVTFSDITELQANNQKLLKLIRDLTDKKEETEQMKDQMETDGFESKLVTYKNRVDELTEAQGRQVKMINDLIKQRDTYKKMCNNQSLDVSFTGEKGEDSDDFNNTNKLDTQKLFQDKFQYVELLETQLASIKKELNQEKETHRLFVEKTKANELKLVEMNDSAHKQFNELHSKYIKCLSSSESMNEKCKILQINLSTYKRDISSLSEKINSYTLLTGKQESSLKKINDELSLSRNKLMATETLLTTLQHERGNLIDASNDSYAKIANKSQSEQDHSSALKNIEYIKSSIENENSESVVMLQTTVEEANRTCSTLRCMLQLEQSKYHDSVTHLKDEINQCKTKIDSEQTLIEKLKQDLEHAEQELKSKNVLINELNSRISHSNVDSGFNTISTFSINSLQKQSSESADDVEVLKQQLEISRQHIEKYCNIYECSEKDLKALNETFIEYKQKTDIKIQNSLKREEELKNSCGNLENKLASCSDEILSMQNKLNSLSLTLADKSASLDKAILDIAKLSESVQIAEDKYAYEIVLHSSDIQALAQLKEQMLELNQKINTIECSKTELECALKENQESWANREKMLIQENVEIKEQLQDLNKQNTILQDQIQNLSTKLTSAHSENLNTSASDDTSNNLPEELKSSEQLLQIIKYLRKEKDILLTKFELMQTENQRIKTQLETTETQLDFVKLTSNEKKNPSELLSETHSGVMRKVETLNAMSDCFIDLRKERDSLLLTVQELTDRYAKTSETVTHVQESNCELTAKISLLQTENDNFREEVNKWKNRANALIEKDDLTSIDDIKKLHVERESLSKMLATEKENVKRLSDEILKVRSEKTQYESQIDNLCKQQTTINESLRKKMGELTNLKKDFDKINQELVEAKSTIAEKTKEIADFATKLNNNEVVIADIRNKEAQVRKIGKRYKTQYEELLKTNEEEKKKSAALVSEAATTSENHLETCKVFEQKTIDLEKVHEEKINNLKNQINSCTEENKNLQKEIDLLKNSSLDKEEKGRALLKQARVKLLSLTEGKENLTKEVNELKTKLDIFEQNKDENDVRVSALKSQYDGRVAKLEKEKTLTLQEKQTEITQLYKQNDFLMQKVKKLETQQNPKPSTSSNQGEKCNVEPPTANIKPMAGVISQRDTNRRATGEPPLASIRPMGSHTGVRTAAVLPTSAQLSALYSVLQSPHTTGNVTGDTLSSPSSSHATEYMPSSSSTSGRLHTPHSRLMTLPPPESTQDMDTDAALSSETSTVAGNSAPSVPQAISSQVVALVLPRMENTPTEVPVLHPHEQQASSSSNNNSSSSTVTTSHGPISGNSNVGNKSELHRAFKKPLITSAHPQKKTILKRPKLQNQLRQLYQGFQRNTENESDYQIPTSSQRDQEDEMVGFGDSEDDENYQVYEIEDEENEMEDKERSSTEIRNATDSVISEEQEVIESNNEVDVNDDSSQEVRSSHREENNAMRCDETNSEDQVTLSPMMTMIREQQIETISSGTGITSGTVGGAYEDADDSIVPSTPTLFIPARNDGFGEAVRGPFVNEGRFTFSESGSSAAGDIAEDTRADLVPQLKSRDHSSPGNPSVSTNNVNATAQTSEAEVRGSMSSGSAMDDESPTVSSQSMPSSFTSQVEEGREAEASSTGSTNSPNRGPWRGGRGLRHSRVSISPQIHIQRNQDQHQRPSPIVWISDGNRRGSFVAQRGLQRGGRHVNRRPPNYYKRF